MSKAALIARILLGLIFFVFGLNGFLNFIPVPPPPAPALKFFGAMMETGYFFPFLKGVEVLMGLALLANRFVPLALVILSPIVIQIFLFHYFLAPSELALPIVMIALMLLLGHHYRAVYKPMLRARV